MTIHCNARVATTNMVGELNGYGTVWYHPDGIANIRSLSRIKENGYCVTYDSADGNKFIVYKQDGTTRTFMQSERGLFYLDAWQHHADGIIFVNTVADNRSKYTNRAYSQAVLARKIQKTIGRPSTRHFIDIVTNNLLPNCPISRDNILAAEDIFGPDVGSLKGKPVRHGSDHVESRAVPIPASLISHYKNVTMGADIMYVYKLPFFVTISHNIKFGTPQLITDQKHDTLVDSLRRVRATYAKCGFKLDTIHMDGQFENIRADLAEMEITMNTVARGKHVPEIERHIRTINERARSVYNTLPLTKMPGRMLAEMIYYAVFCLNSFPARDGISDTLSPHAIITGSQIDFAKHCRLEFGAYVQAHEEHDNTMTIRTTGTKEISSE